MMKKVLSSILLMTIGFVVEIPAQELNKTQVLILATPHLSQIKDFDAASIKSVVSKLKNYKFDLIGVESMSAQLLLDIKSRSDTAFNDMLNNFAGERFEIAEKMQKKLRVSYLYAQKQVQLLSEKTKLTSSDRIKLIEYLFATYDVYSAVLQSKYLEDNLIKDTLLVNILNQYKNSPNEIIQLGVNLAYERNIQNITYVDDFQDETILLKYFPAFMIDFQRDQTLFADLINLPVYKKSQSLSAIGVKKNDLGELYNYLNSKEYIEADNKAQWEIWFSTKFPSKSDRSRYSLWEMRNLQIASHIMKTVAMYPTKKILIIIGASHKYFLEKYLSQMPDVELLRY